MQSSFDTVTSLVCRLKSDDLRVRAAAGQLFSGSVIETENLRLDDRFSFALDQRLAFLSSGLTTVVLNSNGNPTDRNDLFMMCLRVRNSFCREVI